MRQFGVEVKEQKELKKILCNCCGKELTVKDGMVREGVFSAECSWGYFSKKDGETHFFDLCEECYDKWIGGFKIPVEIRE